MNTTQEPAGRQALAEQLRQLHHELRQRRKTQKDAVGEANRRRRTAADRPGDVPWPRKEGGADLPLQTVNDWFPKGKGSKEPSVPPDFEDLWSVVAVMLEWTGQLRDKPSASRLHYHWHRLYEDAQGETSLDEEVRGYLEAARKAAEQHPYQGIPGQIGPPSLAEVYVRQHSRPADRDGPAAPRDGSATEPAEAVFRKADRMCVIIAGPGGGKSTLLRTRLHDAAGAWLGSTPTAGKPSPAVPIWVSARALAGEETQVPDALAASTRRLSRYGRHPELASARFLERPCTGAHWQLLVDDLDELPTADERRAVLQKLANAVTQDPPVYRCVVATRPLTENELTVLGDTAPHYELQPFTIEDLHTYVEKYFSSRWPHEEAIRRAQQFAGALRDASLIELARTPLMASMLCQLYFAQPERPLPDGRTAVYEAFTDLLYENNQHKRVADSHEQTVKRLVDGLQSPRARNEADAAARQVHERLPELIDYLAHQWLTRDQTPVAEVLASHEAVHRPGKVRPERWDAFLEDLLRHTGLLVLHADGLGFPHQTVLEFHAARHAIRDEPARAELLDELFPPGHNHQPATEPSYLGFLLDGLLASSDATATETANRIAALIGRQALDFLVKQVALRTNLPPDTTSRQLTRIACDPAADDAIHIVAAEALAQVEGHREEGAALLASLARDPTSFRYYRVEAAEALARVEGHREEGAALLATLARDPTVDDYARIAAAEALARMGGHREEGAALLASLARDPTVLHYAARRTAADTLAGMGQGGAALLASLVRSSPIIDTGARIAAAEALNLMGEQGAALLASLACDPAVDGYPRMVAAATLAGMVGHREEGAALLASLARDPTVDHFAREEAAKTLAGMGGHREEGAALLATLARDPAG